MPDFDVEVLGLTSPPAAAPVTSYAPALSVRNNGLTAVEVTGLLRIYQKEAPGSLLQTIQLTPKTIAAGLTAPVYGSLYWSPTEADIGTSFIFTADITATNDQVEQNNHLNPTTVTVVPGEPPPPPPVTAHATQHEAGGTDPIDLSNLQGKLADAQTPEDHASSHQVGGADQLNIGGLSGLLADPQTPVAHGGAAHTEDYLTTVALADHNTDNDAHEDSSGLVHSVAVGAPMGIAPLDTNAQVPIDHLPISGTTSAGVFILNDQGDTNYASNAGHQHRGAGGLGARRSVNVGPLLTQVLLRQGAVGFFDSLKNYALHFRAGFEVEASIADQLVVWIVATPAESAPGTIAQLVLNFASTTAAGTTGMIEIDCVIEGNPPTAQTYYAWRATWNNVPADLILGRHGQGGGQAFASDENTSLAVYATWSGTKPFFLAPASLLLTCDEVPRTV